MIKKVTALAYQPANLAVEHKAAAIPKLQSRIKDLEEFDMNTIKDLRSPEPGALADKCDYTLAQIFGENTLEYKKYRIYGLYEGGALSINEPSIYEIRESYNKGIQKAILTLKTLIALFEEDLNHTPETPVAKAKKVFGEMDIHPEIARAATKLFNDGHYANAVEDACKVLDGLVKIRSGKHEISGTELMQNVFSPHGPILAFTPMQTDYEKNEQKGMMYLYAGAMLALRNPRAHAIIEDDPEKALESICFLSLLVKWLDKANKV